MSASNPLDADVQRLEPDALIELFELDLRSLGGEVLRFHAYLHAGVIRWMKQDYKPWPVQVSGLSRSGDASQPTPTISVANVTGDISRLCQKHADMAGAIVRRLRTLARYLDGSAEPNTRAQMPTEIWFVEQKTCETAQSVEFSLRSALDLAGHKLPARQVIASVCQWKYKGPECRYGGTSYFTRSNQKTADASRDECGHRLSSCRLRHPSKDQELAELPFGGFPGAGVTGTVIRLP
ncbi:phage minor tail protein L [Paraburkholderia azotifigens]|uniref:phage minor tail protein L n=1 Tax=Paraburkholderia azotifigens TaxID=2057004 RepID=UPI00317F10FA